MVLLVIKHKDNGILSISEYPSIKEAERVYKQLFTDDFDKLVFIEATEYL